MPGIRKLRAGGYAQRRYRRGLRNWRVGAEGERATERALRPLERSGWRVFHDVQERYGNYDHIVVGRAGTGRDCSGALAAPRSGSTSRSIARPGETPGCRP
jgi:Nuclease-related domain